MKIPERPVGVNDKFDEQVDLMFDLLAIAYQADITRVATYLMVAEGTNQTYNHIGVADSFHPISHHANEPDENCQGFEDPDLAHGPLRQLPAEDGGDQRRRRHAAGSLGLHVRIEHGQQRQAQQLADSDRHRWRRQRQDEAGWPAHRLCAANAAGQRAPDPAAQVRHRTGQDFRQHGRDFRDLKAFERRLAVDRRQVLKGAMTGALTLWASPLLRAAQQASAAAGVKKVTDRVSVIDAGTNVVVLSGGDGLLLVDTGAPKSGDKLTAALKGIAANAKVDYRLQHPLPPRSNRQ